MYTVDHFILYFPSGHLEVVALLIDAGANIEARDSEERTPLVAAALGGRDRVTRLMLDRGAEVTETFNRAADCFLTL